MNNKGQVFFFTLMLAVVVIILVLALGAPIKEIVNNTRNTTISDLGTDLGGAAEPGLDCTNSSLSDFDKGTCIIADLSLPYFIGIGIALAGIVIGARILSE